MIRDSQAKPSHLNRNPNDWEICVRVKVFKFVTWIHCID